MKKILALTLTIIMTCTAFGSCGKTAQQSAESKAATTTTTTTETTTETPAETEETTTTTTATENETTTTTEAAEETETATETEAPAEKPEETGIVTYPDNDEGLYPMPECFRRKVEECSGNSVVSVDYDTIYNTYYASVDDGRKYIYYIGKIDNYESEIITDLEDYILSDSTVPEYDGIIVYAPKE